MNKQRLSQLIVFPLLLIAAFAAIISFGVTTSGFVQDYLARSPAIVYDRRLWAMLGIGLALFGIVTWGVSESMLKGGLEPKISRWVNRLIAGGIILMVALPVISGLVASQLLEKRGYFVCEQAAYPYSLPGLGEKIYLNRPDLCVHWREFREQQK